MTTIKLRKCFAKFMITVALPKELHCKGFVTTVELTYASRCSSESNKLRYVHSIGGTSRETAVEERGINNILKSKSSRFSFILVETVPLDIDKFKLKKRCFGIGRISFIRLKFSWVYPVNHMFKVNIINI